MKRIVYYLLISIIVFACAKEKSLETNGNPPTTGGGNTGGGSGNGGGGTGNSTYYIRAKIDGTLKTFDVSGVATFITTGTNALSMGALSAAGEAMSLSIGFQTGEATAGKTYTESLLGIEYKVLGTYITGNGDSAFVAGLSLTPSADPLAITILTKTTSEISGTFRGAFYEADENSGEISATRFKRFTEGAFKLPIQ